MIFLLTGILVPWIGPVLYTWAAGNARTVSFINGFNFIALTGIVLSGIIPELYSLHGFPVFLFTILGFFLPTLFEGLFHSAEKKTHTITLFLSIVGIALHSALDGLALNQRNFSAEHMLLPFSVVLHQLPVGITIWWLLADNRRMALSVMVIITVMTVSGYFFGSFIGEQLNGFWSGAFQALVSGSLLHVLFHNPAKNQKLHREEPVFAGAGGMFGLVLLTVMISQNMLLEGATAGKFLQSFTSLLLTSAPALLLGYILAGVLDALIPASYFRWLKGGGSLTQSLKGMAVGLPVPVCSCGVVPLYQSLIHRGTPLAAGTSFLIATPELGIDAVLLSIPLLGADMTMARIIAAAAVAFLMGLLMGKMFSSNGHETHHEHPHEKTDFMSKIRKGAHFGLIEVVDHSAPWIFIGILLASVAQMLIQPGSIPMVHSWISIPLFALAGIPLYVCASGATPLVAILLGHGVSPGAALAFLLTGPATNVTTFGILARLHGKKMSLVFSVAMFLLSVVAGLVTDLVLNSGTSKAAFRPEAEKAGWLQYASLAGVLLLYFYSFVRKSPRNVMKELISPFSSSAHSHGH